MTLKTAEDKTDNERIVTEWIEEYKSARKA